MRGSASYARHNAANGSDASYPDLHSHSYSYESDYEEPIDDTDRHVMDRSVAPHNESPTRHLLQVFPAMPKYRTSSARRSRGDVHGVSPSGRNRAKMPDLIKMCVQQSGDYEGRCIDDQTQRSTMMKDDPTVHPGGECITDAMKPFYEIVQDRIAEINNDARKGNLDLPPSIELLKKHRRLWRVLETVISHSTYSAPSTQFNKGIKNSLPLAKPTTAQLLRDRAALVERETLLKISLKDYMTCLLMYLKRFIHSSVARRTLEHRTRKRRSKIGARLDAQLRVNVKAEEHSHPTDKDIVESNDAKFQTTATTSPMRQLMVPERHVEIASNTEKRASIRFNALPRKILESRELDIAHENTSMLRTTIITPIVPSSSIEHTKDGLERQTLPPRLKHRIQKTTLNKFLESLRLQLSNEVRSNASDGAMALLDGGRQVACRQGHDRRVIESEHDDDNKSMSSCSRSVSIPTPPRNKRGKPFKQVSESEAMPFTAVKEAMKPVKQVSESDAMPFTAVKETMKPVKQVSEPEAMPFTAVKEAMKPVKQVSESEAMPFTAVKEAMKPVKQVSESVTRVGNKVLDQRRTQSNKGGLSDVKDWESLECTVKKSLSGLTTYLDNSPFKVVNHQRQPPSHRGQSWMDFRSEDVGYRDAFEKAKKSLSGKIKTNDNSLSTVVPKHSISKLYRRPDLNTASSQYSWYHEPREMDPLLTSSSRESSPCARSPSFPHEPLLSSVVMVDEDDSELSINYGPMEFNSNLRSRGFESPLTPCSSLVTDSSNHGEQQEYPITDHKEPWITLDQEANQPWEVPSNDSSRKRRFGAPKTRENEMDRTCINDLYQWQIHERG